MIILYIALGIVLAYLLLTLPLLLPIFYGIACMVALKDKSIDLYKRNAKFFKYFALILLNIAIYTFFFTR